jgi:transcriptional regulator with XRE-family HTH domain
MITKNDRKLGERIQKLRKKSGLKQHQVAEKVGISSKYIQYIEAASRRPSLKTLYKIAAVLKVKVNELFPF